MILKNFFKPRWQHSNPQVRRQALEELAGDPTVLTEMVRRDPDPALRILAIGYHTDLTILDLVTRTDAQPTVRERAVSRLCEVLAAPIPGGPSLQERITWIKQADTPVLLAHVLRHGIESAVRLAVLERITDDEVLAASAVADPDARIRLAAATRLQDRTLLERVSKLSRNRDKGVHRLLQDRLNGLIEAEERPRRLRVVREKLCADVEALGRRGHWRDAAAPLERLESRWGAAEGEADPDVSERFAAAVAMVRQGLAAEEVRRREQAHIEEELALVRDKKHSICRMVEDLATDLASRGELSHEDASLARTLLRTAETGWVQSGVLPDPEGSALRVRFEGACSVIEHRLGNLLHRAEQQATRRSQCARAEQALNEQRIVEERTLKEWPKEWQALGANTNDDPEEHDLMQRFQTAMQRLRDQGRLEQDRRGQAYASAETSVIELEQALEQGSLKTAIPALSAAKTALGDVPVEPRTVALRIRVEIAATEVHKLIEWQRWGNVRERDRLCAEVEALATEPAEPESLAAQIREIRDVWNRLGPLERDASNQAERFNAACAKAFEPCRLHFAEQARRREEAAKEREALIARVEAFTAGADGNDRSGRNAQVADSFLQEMREAWRNAGPMDRRTLVRLQERFTAALEPLQREVRQAHRNTLKEKENLVARAEAAQKLFDLRVAANEIKQIQIEWKALGHAPRRQEQSLWRRLRAAANDVFDRRHAEVLAQEAERNTGRAAREALCEQLENLAQRIEDTHPHEVATLEQQWATAAVAPREEMAALENRFRKALAVYQDALATFRRRARWKDVEQWEVRGHLCTELETLVGSDARDPAVVEALCGRWNALEPCTDPRITARFDRALQPPAMGTMLDTQAMDALEMVLIRLEIFAGIDSPPESARVRLSHQVNRLAAGLGQAQEAVNPEQRHNQLIELLRAYHVAGPIPVALRTVLESRLTRVLAAVQETQDYR